MMNPQMQMQGMGMGMNMMNPQMQFGMGGGMGGMPLAGQMGNMQLGGQLGGMPQQMGGQMPMGGMMGGGQMGGMPPQQQQTYNPRGAPVVYGGGSNLAQVPEAYLDQTQNMNLNNLQGVSLAGN